jgi:geranylgeranyl reductase family protein
VRRFDAIVVGAGPAGSLAAHDVARTGAAVLLLDRARFPRDKPCGGGLSPRAVRLLPFSVDPVVEQVANGFEFRFRFGRGVIRRSNRPLVLMTRRRRLDAFLAERAVDAGAEFRQSAKVTAVEADADRAVVTVGGERLEAEVVIGADGVNGISARALGLDGRRAYTVALEGNVAAEPSRPGDCAVIELGTVPGGYGWVFPKAGHANVGVWGWTGEGPRLRSHLADLCRAHGYDERSLQELKGYRLPLRTGPTAASAGRAVLTGDAAGLVDPFTGDGIYEAVLSGRLAAEAVADLLAGRSGDLEAYSQRLAAALAPLHASSWALKRAFDRFPRVCFGITRAPLVWSVAEAVFRGELATPGAARGIVRMPLRVLDLLGRPTSLRTAS